MSDDNADNHPSLGDEDNSQSPHETLEADVLEETNKAKQGDEDNDEVLLSDVAVTAEFDYIDLDDESEASEEEESSEEAPEPAEKAGITKKNGKSKKVQNGSDDGPITRALHDFDSYLDDADGDEGDLASPNGGPGVVSDPNLSSPGAWGYDQPQVSGVFSRYEEETREGDSDEFDLFEEEEGEQPGERTLQDIVNAHEKQVRRLEKRLAYQKEVIQVVSELLVEARVISKRELKKRLRALRDKS